MKRGGTPDGGATAATWVGVSDSAGRHRIAFTYRVTGDLRFISHHDTMRMFRRALVRCRLPVRYTTGFNPHPRISIPLPRPVGMASDAEVLVVELTEALDAGQAAAQLASQAPGGLVIIDGRVLGERERLSPRSARYRLMTGPVTPDLRESLQRLQQTDVVPVTRQDSKGRTTRTFNLNEHLMDVDWGAEWLDFWLRVSDDGSIRPSEVAAALGFDARTINHRICRMEVRWQ